jgi:hypothetical protein
MNDLAVMAHQQHRAGYAPFFNGLLDGLVEQG